jgi:hypothetical protein
MYYAWERLKMHADFSHGNLKVRDHMEDLGLDGRVILKRINEIS